ncbi:hypothetical protein HFO26_35620 [Rhizobium leguminosarum]|uniref:hypothetical protein n=1 Tax=Rhizobium leguminosarum TaxID=384 RepID=UPI001C9538E0|nr:hypothetical protein [Rhizobium leguminosarum]MBY5735503.1 hypothetical protein [Rhizobium leguminosarum]
MSVPVRMEFPCARCDRPAATVFRTVSESAAPIAAVVAHAARYTQAYAAPAPAWGRVAARRARGGVCQILVLVNRLKKEHSV